MPGIPGLAPCVGSGSAATGQSVTRSLSPARASPTQLCRQRSGEGHQRPRGPANHDPATTHRITSGETGWSVARKYGISIRDLATANNLETNMVLKVGQTLKIPARQVRRPSRRGKRPPVRARPRRCRPRPRIRCRMRRPRPRPPQWPSPRRPTSARRARRPRVRASCGCRSRGRSRGRSARARMTASTSRPPSGPR